MKRDTKSPTPESMLATRRSLLVLLTAVALAGWPAIPLTAEEPALDETARPLDVLVIAPHSDDEAIGCAGVMLRAIERKHRVGVVIVTAGDGFPKAAAALTKKEESRLTAEDFLKLAALRQQHSMQAMKRIGLAADELIFLGYPDGGLEKMYAARDDALYRQPFTGQTATYGVDVADYHRRVHGRPAPYTRTSVLADLTEIIKARQPRELYVTGEADSHGDHRATFWFVRDAARAADYRGTLRTYIVHGRPPEQPPEQRLALTDSEQKFKRALIEGYQAGVSPVHDQLADTYAKPEELFWAFSLQADSKR